MRPSRTSLLLARGALRSSASRCFFLTSSFTSASSSLSIVIESRTFFIRSYGITRNYKRTTMVSHPKKRPPRRLSTLGQEGVWRQRGNYGAERKQFPSRDTPRDSILVRHAITILCASGLACVPPAYTKHIPGL